MIKQWLMVGLGGALGSMLRFGITQLLPQKPLPWATLLINCSGSFLIGCIAAYALRNQQFDAQWKLFLATGICGGFTTFSAFSLENVQLLQSGKISLLTTYVLLSLAGGMGAAFLGFKLFQS